MSKARLQKAVGARIRQIRKDKNITQEEFAKSIGKLRPVIQRIEGGSVNPAIYTLREIAALMSVVSTPNLEDFIAIDGKI